MNSTRREFIGGAAAVGGLVATSALPAFAALPPLAALTGGGASGVLDESAPFTRSEKRRDELIDNWDAATWLVEPKDFFAYIRDGDTRGLKALAALERAFDKVVREAKETVVTGDVPAVWSVYNMGYVVKTRESLFTIDIKHRRDEELVPSLDFALVTHNHGDHWRRDFYKAMDSAGKTVVSNFLGNKGASECGHASGEKVFKIKDVEIRTFRVDHAEKAWGVDFTTAFEIKTGDFRLLHTGDCRPSNGKLCVKWGRPDLWLFFPMSGLDIADAMRRIEPKRVVFGHLWELGHAVGKGRAHKWHIDRAMPKAKSQCGDVSVAFWGDRII